MCLRLDDGTSGLTDFLLGFPLAPRLTEKGRGPGAHGAVAQLGEQAPLPVKVTTHRQRDWVAG